jgi:hypothetical protein
MPQLATHSFRALSSACSWPVATAGTSVPLGRNDRSESQKRSFPIAARWTAITFALLFVLAASCGTQAHTVAPKVWASEFCSALNQWSLSSNAASASFRSTMAKEADPATVKADTLSYLSGQQATAEKVVSAIDRAGVPGVPDGSKIANALRSAFSLYSSSVAAAATKLAQVSPQNAITLSSAIDAVGSAVDDATTKLGSSIARISKIYGNAANQALMSALDANPSCKAFAAGS